MRKTIVAGIATVMLGAWAVAGTADPGTAAPAPDPADYDDPVMNPYFPLVPGTVLRYRGDEDGVRFRERVRVTDRTKTIQGIVTTVVIDVLFVDGALAERTEDWYANDDLGNVWYFGEDTAEFEDGVVVSTSGSWTAGVGDATAGVIMPADPGPTDAYRQELAPGEAEDQAWIVQRRPRLRTPMGVVHHVVRVFEWTRLEPHVLVQKFYARGLGLVAERVVTGGVERLDLVGVESL